MDIKIDRVVVDEKVHQNIVIESSPKLSCTYDGCTKQFLKAKSLGEHVRRCHKGQKRPRFSCLQEGCEASYRDKPALDVHTNRVHKGSAYPHACQMCDNTFKTRDLLTQHKKLEHTGLQLLKKVQKERGGKEEGARDSFVCHTCGKLFSTKDSLRIHFRHHGPRKYVCTICSKRFVSKNYLDKHMTVHTNEKNFHCSQCGKGFKEGGNLKKHLKICGTSLGRKFKCEICAKVYKTDASYQQHLLVHQGVIEYPYKCDLCDHSVRFQSMLVLHRKSHFETREFSCDVCPAKFKYKNNLNLHCDVRHLGKRGQPCSGCDFVGINKQTLECHCRTHTGDRPYSCDTCGGRFRKPNHLKRHSQLMHRSQQNAKTVVKSSENNDNNNTIEVIQEEDSMLYMNTEVVVIEESNQSQLIPVIQMENEEIKIYHIVAGDSGEEEHVTTYQVELV